MLLHCMESAAPLSVDLIVDSRPLPQMKIVGSCEPLAEGEPAAVVSGQGANIYFSCIESLFNKETLSLEPFTRIDEVSPRVDGELGADCVIAHRLLESRLYDAEMWGALALRYGFTYAGDQLHFAWRQLQTCQSQHEENELAFADRLAGYREALEIAVGECHRAQAALASQISTETGDTATSLIVFNSLPWTRNALVRQWVEGSPETTSFSLTDSSGASLPFEVEAIQTLAHSGQRMARLAWVQPQLPAGGFETVALRKIPGQKAPSIRAALRQTWVENEFYRIEIDPSRGGGIVSLYDKQSRKEWIDGQREELGNDLSFYSAIPAEDPIQPVRWRELERASRNPVAVDYLEGPVTQRLLIHGQQEGVGSWVQEISLAREIQAIDCVTTLESTWGHEQQPALCTVSFPLALPGALPVVEEPFYAQSRFYNIQPLDFSHPMQRWMDVSWALLLQFQTERDVDSHLAIGPAEIVYTAPAQKPVVEQMVLYLARHGVTCTIQPGRYAPLPAHGGTPPVLFCIGNREDNEYTSLLLDCNPQAIPCYERHMQESGFVILVVEDRLSVPRIAPHPAIIVAGKTASHLQQAMNAILHATASHRWTLPRSQCFLDHPLPIANAGLAVLSQGGLGCTVTPDLCLTLGLLQASPFPSPLTAWPRRFAHERTRVFPYRLVPHQGDWREAQIPRRAMDYVHPPLTLEEPAHAGGLAPRTSFLSLHPRNVMIASIAPASRFDPDQPAPPASDPLAVRCYEMFGERSNLWLDTLHPPKTIQLCGLDGSPYPLKRPVYWDAASMRTEIAEQELLTFHLKCKPGSNPSRPLPSLAPSRPLPVLSRYWRYNLGCAPAATQRLSLFLRGSGIRKDMAQAIYPMELVLVNNSTQAEQALDVQLLTPPYWRTIPSSLSTRVSKQAYQIIPFQLLVDGPEREGRVVARVTLGDTVIEDHLVVGRPTELEVAMTHTGQEIAITLANPSPFEISGFVSLIPPVESWASDLVGPFALAAFMPSRQAFSIPPQAKVMCPFEITRYEPCAALSAGLGWMLVKIAAEDTLRYYHVSLNRGESGGLGQILFPPYESLPQPEL
ncbi:MAG: hypothetical protein RBU29_14345 [bacterium]|jgi:alpha-mannosidase|nr:hypothetical protein [bacterium]